MAKRKRKVHSTSDITVFGLPVPSALSDEIWYGRASRKDALKAYLRSASAEEKTDFFKHFCVLQDMLLEYLAESERLVLLLDNSTIQDVLQQNKVVKRKARYNSLLALLIEVEDYHLIDAFSAITPVILYEANGCCPIQAVATWNEIRSAVTHAMAAIGLDTTYVGFRNFGQLFHTQKDISEDEKQIRHALEIIQGRNWLLDASMLGSGRPISLSIAEDNVPNIGLQYFNVQCVKYLLMHLIEAKIADSNSNLNNDQLLTIPKAERLPSVLKLKSDKLTGLGDVELLSECALNRQATPEQLSMAVSADDALNRTLVSHTHRVLIGPSYQGGTDPIPSVTSSMYMCWRENRKLKRTNARAAEHRKEAITFMENHLSECFP